MNVWRQNDSAKLLWCTKSQDTHFCYSTEAKVFVCWQWMGIMTTTCVVQNFSNYRPTVWVLTLLVLKQINQTTSIAFLPLTSFFLIPHYSLVNFDFYTPYVIQYVRQRYILLFARSSVLYSYMHEHDNLVSPGSRSAAFRWCGVS